MSQYIAVEVSTSMTWTFNTLTIINDLIFAYFLHKISKRLPIPFQFEDNEQNNENNEIHYSNNKALSLVPLNQQNMPKISTKKIEYNLHSNKYINLCYICNYKLTHPTYPSYFFDDITPDRRKELLENHWKTIQDQTPDNMNQQKQKSESTDNNNSNGLGLFAITAKRMTTLVFKKRSYIQYASLSLRLWSIGLGIIALALSWSFWMNILLEYCIACVFNHGATSDIFGLLAMFAIIHCAMFWLKRQWQALKLLWYNTCDSFYISIGIWWRFINLLLCLSFTLWSSIDSNLTISDSIFWQLFLRWMVLQGLLWEIGYAALNFIINIWVVYRLYLLKYDFQFMKNLGKSHLKSIRKTINNMSNKLTKDNKNENENEIENENDLTRLHEIEVRQYNLLQSLQCKSRNNNSTWYTIIEVICALKDNENYNKLICFNRIKLIYIKYFYIFMIIIAIIVCFIIGENEKNKSMCTFAAWMFLMYYFIVLFRRAKYNALFCFWSSKYHSRFYNNLQIIYSFESQKRAQSKSKSIQLNDSLLNESMLGVSSEAEEEYIRMNDDEKKDIENIQCAKEYGSNISNKKEIIIYKDSNRSIFIRTISIDYMDFWSMIELDDNDFYGCSVFCGATKELCAVIIAIILIIIFVLIAISWSNTDYSSSSQYIVNNQNDKIITPYPMCQVEWVKNYLNLLDMVYLTIVAYYSDKMEVKNLFQLWFGSNFNETGWQFNNIYIQSEKPAFFHISNVNGLQVVAVRGTYDMDDVLQDVSLYSEIATLQTFSWIIPLTTVLPVGFIRDFIKYASIPEGIIDPTLRDRYDEPIYNYVLNKLNNSLTKINNENNNQTIFIMGHSLGGGVAEIVAAKFTDQGYKNVYSFGLSSPGTLWSSLKFGFSVESLDKSSISVLPRRDPISLVDKHGGVQQIIECNAKETPYCHLSERSFCEIYQECGLKLVRNLTFVKCVCGNVTTVAKDWSACW